MAKYKNIIAGWVNERKDKSGHYLTLTNVSGEDIVIKPAEKLYLNRTPADVLKKYPTTPHYSKSIKVEEKMMTDEEVEEVNNDVPF